MPIKLVAAIQSDLIGAKKRASKRVKEMLSYLTIGTIRIVDTIELYTWTTPVAIADLFVIASAKHDLVKNRS